jgi:hypothetical protein
MELAYLLMIGSLSGLIGVLAHSVIHSSYELIRSRGTATGSLQLTDAFLHLVCGTGLGLLFWLSWGLAAIVDVRWWVRGLTFAGLCWFALSLPAILSAWLSAAPERGISFKSAAVMASRWATTCLIAGLTCAWSWHRSV